MGDLKEVFDDDLVVGAGVGVIVNRARDGTRIGIDCSRGGIICRQCGTCQRDPELGIGRGLPFVAALTGCGPVVDQSQPVERQRMQREVGPLEEPAVAFETERPASIGFTRKGAQRMIEFLRLNSTSDAHGADVMAVESFGQSPEHGLIRVGRHAVDDQLAARNAEGDHPSVLEQPARPIDDRIDNGAKRRMSARVHRITMQRDGQLDEKLAQLTRQNTAL